MIILFFLLAFLFATFRGIHEGMVMIRWCDRNAVPQSHDTPSTFQTIKDGVRIHKWFRNYHFINMVMFADFAGLVYVTFVVTPHWNEWVAVILLVWEVTEVAYSFTRYGKYLPAEECIEFIDRWDGFPLIKIDSLIVYRLHITRIVGIIIFLCL